MKNQRFYIIIFLITLLIAVSSWFFAIRPSQIRSSCAEKSDEDVKEIIDLNKLKGEDGKGNITIEQGQLLDKVWERNYKQCLRRDGLV